MLYLHNVPLNVEITRSLIIYDSSTHPIPVPPIPLFYPHRLLLYEHHHHHSLFLFLCMQMQTTTISLLHGKCPPSLS